LLTAFVFWVRLTFYCCHSLAVSKTPLLSYYKYNYDIYLIKLERKQSIPCELATGLALTAGPQCPHADHKKSTSDKATVTMIEQGKRKLML
jgi:hypothetical protein